MARTIGKLERGWAKYRLIADLAAMENTQVELAEKYSCVQSTISDFAKRHAAEISAKKQALADDLHGLWVARKADRLAEYQQTIEDIEDFVESTDMSDKDAREAVALKLRALRAVADELGQVPQRPAGGGSQTTVTISVDGVAVEDLR